MSIDAEELNLQERVNLIESMIAEGRRTAESWGWTFVLWGIAYYVAIFWAAWSVRPWSWPAQLFDGNHWAWPITMLSAVALTMVIGLRGGRGKPNTGAGRAVSSIWSAMGVSMLLLFPALSIAGKIDNHSFIAIVAAFLGTANGACGVILKWRAELLTALVWWISSVLVCFGTEEQMMTIFLIAIFLCQIVFGVYAMISEARAHRQESNHA